MSFLPWSASYETGHPDIDRQHKHLFALINGLHEAMRQGRGREVMGQVLEELSHYALEHFAAEEALMASTGYPELERHRELHQELAGRLQDLQLRFSKGYLTLPSTLSRFLADWLKQHVRQEDMRFIRWSRER